MKMNEHQRAIYIKLNTWRMEQESKIVTEVSEAEKGSSLSEIKGIWPATIKLLHSKWIRDTEQLKPLGEEGIRELIQNPLSLKGILNFISWNK